jgi:anti-sigma regulatory factor (Ser/Thr protein kinase)
VPLNQEPLTLAPEARSAQVARRWIASLLGRLEREDLQECAGLGVSELVTNALLHAEEPVAVRLRGTRAHPRIEVSDGSDRPPELPDERGHEDELATFGRGLGILARCSVAWGATIEQDGKVVWFEPDTEPRDEDPPAGAFLEHREAPPERDEEDLVPVVLRGVPVAPVTGLSRHYRELRRELRLLSFAHSDKYPLAASLTDVFARFERVWPADFDPAIEAAEAAGRPAADMDVKVPAPAAGLFDQMRDLLAMADEFCLEQRLLSLARSEPQRALQEWLLGELAGQARGRAPVPWPPASGSPQSRS